MARDLLEPVVFETDCTNLFAKWSKPRGRKITYLEGVVHDCIDSLGNRTLFSLSHTKREMEIEFLIV